VKFSLFKSRKESAGSGGIAQLILKPQDKIPVCTETKLGSRARMEVLEKGKKVFAPAGIRTKLSRLSSHYTVNATPAHHL
jgi:hypothetical protein